MDPASSERGSSPPPFAGSSLRRSGLWEAPAPEDVLPDGVVLRWTSDRASYRFFERAFEGQPPLRRGDQRRASVRHISQVKEHPAHALRRAASLRSHAPRGALATRPPPPAAATDAKVKFSFRSVFLSPIKRRKEALKNLCRRRTKGKKADPPRSTLDEQAILSLKATLEERLRSLQQNPDRVERP